MLKDLAEIERLRSSVKYWRGAELAGKARIVVMRPDNQAQRGTLLTLPALQSHDLQPWRTPVDPAEARRPLTAQPAHLTELTEVFELGNGLRVVLASDSSSPIVDARLVFPGGTAHEPRDRPGVATAAATLLSPDTERLYPRRDALRLRWAMALGTQTDVDVDETTTTFSTRGLARYADWHVWRLSWWLGADLAAQIARLTPAQVRAVAAADLVADRMVVQVAGKRAAVDAAFAKLGVTPE